MMAEKQLTKQAVNPPDGTILHACLKLAMTYYKKEPLRSAAESLKQQQTYPLYPSSQWGQVGKRRILLEICSETQIQIRTITLVSVNQK